MLGHRPRSRPTPTRLGISLSTDPEGPGPEPRSATFSGSTRSVLVGPVKRRRTWCAGRPRLQPTGEASDVLSQSQVAPRPGLLAGHRSLSAVDRPSLSCKNRGLSPAGGRPADPRPAPAVLECGVRDAKGGTRGRATQEPVFGGATERCGRGRGSSGRAGSRGSARVRGAEVGRSINGQTHATFVTTAVASLGGGGLRGV